MLRPKEEVIQDFNTDLENLTADFKEIQTLISDSKATVQYLKDWIASLKSAGDPDKLIPNINGAIVDINNHIRFLENSNKTLGSIISGLKSSIEKIQTAGNLTSFVSNLTLAGKLAQTIQVLMKKIEGESELQDLLADLQKTTEDLTKEYLVELCIYTVDDGEYIADYSVAGNYVIWKIPHFSLYYFVRR